jgi:LacI family transcriptional regulator
VTRRPRRSTPRTRGGRVTIADVAREAGVSKSTVSRAVNDPQSVHPSTLAEVLDVVRRLDFAPNVNARSLTTGRTLVIGVVVSDIQVPFFTSVARAVQDVARAAGYLTLIGNSDERPDTENELIRAFASRMVDGLIVTPTAGENSALREIASRIPIVTVDRLVQGVPGTCVLSDNYSGALAAMRHLVELGHRRIAYVSSSLDKSSTVERMNGYRAGLEEAGIPFEPMLLRAGDYHLDAVTAASTELLRGAGPTAVLTSEASVSVGVLHAAHAIGLAVPTDLSVLSFDPLDWASPDLTAVLQDTARLGMEAMTSLLRQIDSLDGTTPVAPVVRVPTRLVIRASCAPPLVGSGKAPGPPVGVHSE